MTTPKFFKQDELVAELMLTSKPEGMELLNEFIVSLDTYFKSLADSPNMHVKPIISGAQHGYSPAAVADHIIRWKYGSVGPLPRFGEVSCEIYEGILKLMGYEDNTWGAAYDYRPSLEELSMDPIDVQASINERAEKYREVSGNERAAYFGVYANDVGAIRSSKEIDVLKSFRDEVVLVIQQRHKTFLIQA